MKSDWYIGMPVYHHRRRCYGFLLHEVPSDSDEYPTKWGRGYQYWKVLWVIHEDTRRHSEKISIHNQLNLTPSTFTENWETQ